MEEKKLYDLEYGAYIIRFGNTVRMQLGTNTDQDPPAGTKAIYGAYENLMEVISETSDNDTRKGRKADYLTVDPDKMAAEIVAGSAFRGIQLAFALLKESGWGAPDLSVPATITFRIGGASDSNELQPKVPVDTGREPESGGLEDHYPR